MNFAHGGNRDEIAEYFGVKPQQIFDFSASINPLGPSQNAIRAIRKSAYEIQNYPDNRYSKFIAGLSKYHSIAEKNFLVGNGSIELIYSVMRVFQPRKALVVAPCFSEYYKSLKQNGSEVEYFFSTINENISTDIQGLCEQMNFGYDVVVIGNPSNPTGELFRKNQLKMIVEKASQKGSLLIVDEAFIDFCEKYSIKKEAVSNNNIIVIRSMTKYFGIPGIRSGYLISHVNNINKLIEYQIPWRLNIAAENASLASLNDSKFKNRTDKLIETERAYLIEHLSRISILKTYPSCANYILIRLINGIRGVDMRDWLLKKHKLYIRCCDNFPGLGGNFIRIAVKTRKENRLLIGALKKYNEINSK